MIVAVVAVGVLLLATACSSGQPRGDGPTGESSPTSEHQRAARPDYAERGPHLVGIATFHIDDRPVEVYYPASEAGSPRDAMGTYEFVGSTYELRGVRDADPSTQGPFPLIIFNHGGGGSRQMSSAIIAGVASWGFVVAAPEHDFGIQGLITALQGSGGAFGFDETSLAAYGEVTAATRDLLHRETTRPGAIIEGLVDPDRTGVVGYSMGGATTLRMADRPWIDAVVLWSTVVPERDSANGQALTVPVLVLNGSLDAITTPASANSLYESAEASARRVVIDGAGHMSFSDFCPQSAELTALADAVGLEVMGEVVADGCGPENLSPARAARIAQHYTVAHLRAELGIDAEPIGLDQLTAEAFPEGVEFQARGS